MSLTLVEANAFEVGWICALSTEFVAACELLDEEYEVKGLDYKSDENAYRFGCIGRHKIVISCLPKGRYGLTSAASVARDMLRSFPAIRFGLMVGIAGGAPSTKHDIRLGDVVVGCPSGTSGGVINIQYGKNIQGSGFSYTGSLTPPPRVLLSAVNNLIARHEQYGHHIQDTVDRILVNPRLSRRYQSPGPRHDLLFTSRYLHRDDDRGCEDCCVIDKSTIVKRNPRAAGVDDPTIHYGIVASSDSLMKDAKIRTELTKKMDVLCFEMEAAGLMDHFPCLVVRGICDYCDTHKNKTWQGYAAAVAAAYAKELLDIIPSGTNAQQSSVTPSKTYHGLFALAPLKNSCSLDVIAVHGLGGDAVDTWKTSQGYSWMRHWLSEQSEANLLTYGYDSSTTWNGDKSSICDTALDLLENLRKKRPKRNFVFLCHGLGGIIVRTALALSLSLSDHTYLQDKLSGLIFLGTPQGHLHAHEWMTIIYRMSNILLTGKSYRLALMEKVELLSKTLNALSFECQYDVNQLAVLSYYETLAMADSGSLIVEPEAVIMASAGEQVLPLKADHITMVAPDMAALQSQHQAFSALAKLVASSTSDEKPFAGNTELLQKLYCVDYELYSVSVPDASPRTGTWLREQDSFKSWASSQKSQMFWVRAPPGYGKSVIAKRLIRDLKAQGGLPHSLQDLCDYTVLAFFFKEETNTSRTMEAFLRSLLHQLVLQYPPLGSQIRQAFNTVNLTTKSGRDIEPYVFAPALWTAFRSVLHNKLLGKVILVIDGLDEAMPLDVREICHGLLHTLDSVSVQTTLKIFLTSRDNYWISKNLESDSLVQPFEITPDHTRDDIEIYLDNVIAEFAEEHNVPQNTRYRIKEHILQRADGMFLWASLAWDHFQGGVAVWSQSKIQERLEQLESLPPGLDQLYIRLLEKIEPGVLRGLHAVFRIVAAAARPITCEEAEHMLGIKGWETRTTDLDIPFSIRATIKLYCAGLFKVSPAGVIQTVHLSLKDFLSKVVLKQVASALHAKIASDCILYLTLADVREVAERDVRRSYTESCLMKRFVLYDYAASYLEYHMKKVEPDDHVWLQYASMVKHYAGFHVAAASSHMLHVNALELTAPSYYLDTPLRDALRWHGKKLIRTLSRANYNLDEVVYDALVTKIWHSGTAMHSKVKECDIVSELLSCGASPNVPDYSGGTPLHQAIRFGYQSTTRLLLSAKDVDVNVQDSEGRTPLHYEATSGRGSLLLNDPRVDVNLRDKNGRTPVTTAAFWGDQKTTLDFLRSARNVMAQHEGELSILIAAAQQDWLDITLSILNQLPDVSEHRGYDGKSILHWAVINNWEEVLLVAITKAHAKVNNVDKRLRTPLHEAAELGNYTLARKLISFGASARHRDHQGRTPVMLAAIQGFSDTVLALMHSDFDVNDFDSQQRTIVHWAASCDWPVVVRRVIEHPEANFLKHDQMGRTALHIAALCGCPNVLQLLIQEDIFDVNETDSFGNTLLHLAARAGSHSVVFILLQTEIFRRRHSVNQYGQTALDVAIAYDKIGVRDQLREARLRVQKEPTHDSKLYYTNSSKPEPEYHTDWEIVKVSDVDTRTRRQYSPLPSDDDDTESYEAHKTPRNGDDRPEHDDH